MDWLAVVWGGFLLMDAGTANVLGAFEEVFDRHFRRELVELAQEYPAKRSFELDFQRLARHHPGLADELCESPDEYLAAAQEAILNLGLTNAQGQKLAPRVRVHNLPEHYDSLVQNLGADHIDRLLRVEAQVSWITDIKPKVQKAVWLCLYCGRKETTEPGKLALEPYKGECKNCGRSPSAWKFQETESEFINIQRAQVQDPVEKLRGNSPTVHAELWLEDDLVNLIAPGDRVVVTGVLRLKPLKDGKGRSVVYAKFLDVSHVHKVEQEFEELEVSREEEKKIKDLARDPKLFEKMVKSIAPSIYGYDELKEAVALQLLGGTAGKVSPDGEPIRSDSHTLLIGDPGTGKSSILEFVSRIAPKCTYVSGESVTSVGLTAAAERDPDGEGWILKAGALVLADGGVVAVDELDKVPEEQRGGIHSAMEQQFVAIAKAGIVTKFRARTAVLAAANPKLGRFDPNTPPAQQFALSPALLSRFDLIFAIRDVLDESRDKKLASHILLTHRVASEARQVGSASTAVATAEKAVEILPVIEEGLLRKYIAYARKNCFPVLSEEASAKIKDFYVELRRLGKEQNNFPITARQIEGIIRLAEASAKLRLSPKVELQDAERSINLVNFMLRSVFVDKETGRIDSDVINIGQSKARVDKVRTLLSVIQELERKVDLVSVDEVIRECAGYGIDEHYARQLISELLRQGDLYTPKHGHIRSSTKGRSAG